MEVNDYLSSKVDNLCLIEDNYCNSDNINKNNSVKKNKIKKILIPYTDYDELVDYLYNLLENKINNWCDMSEGGCTGEEMRAARGNDIEHIIKDFIKKFSEVLNINVVAIKGNDDKKELVISSQNKEYKKQHQVDIHLYKDNNFIAVIECKAYLDSCYYARACDDFILFKKSGYDLKYFIFSLENSIDEDTKLFRDVITDNICNDIFYVVDGKRSSAKPIYNRKYKKYINRSKIEYFVKSLYDLFDI